MVSIIQNGMRVTPAGEEPAGCGKSGCSCEEIAPKDDLMPVSVNGVVIPRKAIEEEMQHHAAEDVRIAWKEAARALVVQQLLLQEARSLDIQAVPESDEGGRRETEDEARIRALLEAEVLVPSADESACQRYYNNNLSKFRSSDLYEASHILLIADPDDKSSQDAATQQAQELISELLRQPNRFVALAREFSSCPSRLQDGNLGQISKGQTVPEFEAKLAELSEGQMCPVPVKTRFGSHVLKLHRKVPGRLLPFELVREKIATYLEASSFTRAVSQYIALLIGKADVSGVDLEGAQSPLVQ